MGLLERMAYSKHSSEKLLSLLFIMITYARVQSWTRYEGVDPKAVESRKWKHCWEISWIVVVNPCI